MGGKEFFGALICVTAGVVAAADTGIRTGDTKLGCSLMGASLVLPAVLGRDGAPVSMMGVHSAVGSGASPVRVRIGAEVGDGSSTSPSSLMDPAALHLGPVI